MPSANISDTGSDQARSAIAIAASVAIHALALTLIVGSRAATVEAPAAPALMVNLIAGAAPAAAAPDRRPDRRPRLAPGRVPATAPETTPALPVRPDSAATAGNRPPVPEPLPATAAAAPARPPAASAEPVTIPARFDAAYLDNPAPEYPVLSRRLGESGRVVLRVFVSVDGRAAEVDIHSGSGSSRLDAAARDAVRKWRFIPSRRGDESLAAWVLVPVVFNLST